MKTRTHKEQMPARSGRRRGGSEERRGRRPHPSPSRAERNDRPTRVVEELGCFTRRPHGHDSSESDAERTIPPPKRPKVQDSSSSAPTSAHSTGTTTLASHPISSNTLSRESDNEDRQSQASRSSVGGSLANSSSSISSGRDIDQDNRSSSPSLSGSPLASLDSESDSPDSPKQGGKVKDGPLSKPGVAQRADDGGSAECRDSEGGMEANLSPLKSPSSVGPLTDSGSGRKFFSNSDSKIVTKMEFSGPASDEALHSRIGVNPKMAPQCAGKPMVGGAVEYGHGNHNVSHSPSAALPPPPALKPLEAGQGAPSDIKVEKVEKCEKPQAPHLPQPASLPQQAPPSRHPHHYSPNAWSGTSVSSHGNWSYSRYPGVHHAPVQQQQLPSVYNPPSSIRHPNHPPYLPHSHSTHSQQPNTQRDYVPRYSGPAERERPGRDFGIKDASANANATGAATSANPGNDFGTPVPVPGQTRDFGPSSREGPSVGREFRPVFRERDATRDFSLQNLNQQHVAQNREFGSGGTSGATGCHTRDKEERWGEFSGQIRNAGGNSNQSSSQNVPAGSSQNNSATQNKDFQSSVEQVGPQGPPSQIPSAGSDPPSTGHFLREYPPQGVKEYPPASGQPSGPHPGPNREYPSPTGLPSNVGRDFAGGPAVTPGHYMVQPGLSVQSREREREQERENITSSSLYPNRGHPPSLSPSTSSTGHGHQPVPSYPPTSHNQQAPPVSSLPANQPRPTQYPLPNQSPSTPLSPLPSPSKNQMGGFPPFSSTSAPASGVATSCISGCRPAPYHGHTPYPSGYQSSGAHSNTATTSNTNSNSGVTGNVQLHSPPPSKIQPHLCSPVAPQPVGLAGAEGQGDPLPFPVPPPVIKEEPIEEREETDSPSTVLRSPSPEPKPIDIPIHASQSARFHRVLDRGSANSCARTDVLFIPLDGSKLWKKRNEAIERARREVEQRARDLREKERERERERDRERERERDLERHLQQKESNPAAVPRQGSSLFFPPSSSILIDPSSTSSTPCLNHSHQATHHAAHLPHPSHAHSLHPSLAHSIPHSLLLPSVGGLGPYLGPDTPALRTLSEYARPHAMSPLGAPNRAPPHFHHHPHPHPHAHPHMHPSLFLPQFQNPALAHPHHLPADAATAAAILGFLYGSGLEGGHPGHPGAGPVAGPGPGGMAGLGASLGGVGFPHAVAAHRERVKSGFDFKSEFDSHTHSHSHSLLLGGGAGGGAPPSDVAIYGTPPPTAPPPPALVVAAAARNASAVPPPLSTPPASALLPPTLPAHAPPSVNPPAPAPPPPPPAPPPPPTMVPSLHQPSPAPEGYTTPIRTPPSSERSRSVERERERERERVLPSAERERTAPPAGGAGGGAPSGGGGASGGGGGGMQMLNVTPHHHQHSHIHSHLHLHQQDTAAASGVHPLIDPLTTGAPLPRLPYPGSIIAHPLTESDVLRQQLFGGPFRDLPPHSSMHHQNTELQIQRLALEQQWIHHHTHSLTQEEYYSHLKKESDKTL